MQAQSNEDVIWQDREVRFDLPSQKLVPRRGEQQIDSINSVEDTKGNNGDRGALTITNLRITWVCHKRHRTNLSIGFNTVITLSIRKAKSRLRGTHQALYVMAKAGSARYEFIFTSLVKNSPRLFTTCQASPVIPPRVLVPFTSQSFPLTDLFPLIALDYSVNDLPSNCAR